MPDELLRPGESDQRDGEWSRPEAWYVAAARAFLEQETYDVVLRLVTKMKSVPDPLGDTQ